MRNERHASHASTRKIQTVRQLEVVADDALWAIKAFVTIWHSIQQDCSYTFENYSKQTSLAGWRQQSVLQLLRGTTKPIKQTQYWILKENWTKSGAVHGEKPVSKIVNKRSWNSEPRAKCVCLFTISETDFSQCSTIGRERLINQESVTSLKLKTMMAPIC